MARVEGSEQWMRRVIRGYTISGTLFLLSMALFIVAIVTGIGSAAGVGGILLAVSVVTVVVTGIYHYVTDGDYD